MAVESRGLTRSQQLILAGQILQRDAPLYNMALRFDVRGPLDVERFRLAFQTLVDQSDAMRLAFDLDPSNPRQRILPALECEVPLIDFSSRPDAAERIDDWIEGRIAVRLDLSECTFDTAMLRCTESHHVWYLNQHHVATDAWSASLVFRRVSEIYAALSRGRQQARTPAPNYVDFVDYEKAQKSRPRYGEATAFWDRVSQQGDPNIRFYGRRADSVGSRTVRVNCGIGGQRAAGINAIAAAEGVRSLSRDLTVFTLVATALYAFIYRIDGGHAPSLGCPAHNRSSIKFRETIGSFVELFPLRVHVEDDDTFRSLLSRVSGEAGEFLKHAVPGSSTARSAKSYNVVLNFIHASFGDFAGLPTDTRWLHPGHGDPSHHLRVQVLDFKDSGSLEVYFDFNESVFSTALQVAAVRHFLRVLDAMLEDLDCRIAQVPLASDAERRRLVDGFNSGAASDEGADTVMDLFSRWVAADPGATAIRDGELCLSYFELNQRVDAVARRIQAAGSGGTRPLIGVCARRSADLLAAMLGILKAGGAYVPLEPGLPSGRLDYILEDTDIDVVLTTSDLAGKYEGRVTHVLCIDRPWTRRRAGAGTDAELPRVNPGSRAYVIYTSGSSGRPKGVEIDHRGLAEYVRWAIGQYVQDMRLRFPLYSAIGFDLTVTSIFVPLCSGGSVVVYPEQRGAVDLSILDVFRDRAVDVVKLTPAHLQLMCGFDLSDSPVGALIVGGDDLKVELAARTFEAFGGRVTIYNEYGPTEAVVGCMIHEYDPGRDCGLSVPIGRPAGNARIYLLDAGSHPVPVGVSGEICIARPGLSRGYLNHPDLTAERFVDDPFTPGGRMYRSGDRARFVDEDTLVYLGRIDDQLKIGAVRVEAAEVEQALLSRPDVTACCVVAVSPPEAPAQDDLRFCVKCGLASNYPNTTFNSEGVCNICIDFERYRDRAQAYFRAMEHLGALLENLSRRKRGRYDCMMLLSGGKDSTYALYQLAGLGLDIYALTLDNGYISDGAKANIRRTVADLGVTHEFATTGAMDSIFVDSLHRHSSVCYGCFKTIYTLALNIARRQGIPCIVTGLSRGQFFETRLTREVFQDDDFDVDRLDREVLEARKVYHRVPDAVTASLDVTAFEDDSIFEEVEFVDFFRYCDVSLEQTYAFLSNHAPWVRPEDTGRSTNCLINDTGIFVHKRRMGYHNYALPYSWDVRLGAKTRDEALAELNDEIDAANVMRILKDIGYEDADFYFGSGSRKLAAYYVSDRSIKVADLRRQLENWLPAAMIPAYFVHLRELPLTVNGKIDRSRLPHPLERRPDLDEPLAPPATPTQKALAAVWRDTLHLNEVGINDNFFDIGGDSIMALQIVSRVSDLGMRITPAHLFSHQTIGELSALVERQGAANAVESTRLEESRTAEEPLVDLDEKMLGKIARLLNEAQ